MTASRAVIHWATPYGGMQIRGKAPARAHAKALELVRRFTTAADFAGAELSMACYASPELAAWAVVQEPGTTLDAERARGLVGPHPAILPAIARYGPPTFSASAPADGGPDGAILRLDWSLDGADPSFAVRLTEWLDLAVRYAGDRVDRDWDAVQASFELPRGAHLTAPDTATPLTDAPADAFPDGYPPGLSGFATVPGGALLFALCLPLDEPDATFEAFDRALVETLGPIADARYRLVTPKGAVKKLAWRRG